LHAQNRIATKHYEWESIMTDAVIRPTAFTSGAGLRFATPLRRALARILTAAEPRPLLDELPDNVLKDLGFARSEIPFVAGTLVSAEDRPAREALDRLDRRVAKRDTATRLSHVALRLL
jgi:uncharacterized protein YjiS (DUF1127 family)